MSVRVVILVADSPTKCPPQPDFLENSSKGTGVNGCTIMRLWTDRWMDGWIDSMLIAISPKPISRRITKFNKKVLMIELYKLRCKNFYFYMKGCDLDLKVIPRDGAQAE